MDLIMPAVFSVVQTTSKRCNLLFITYTCQKGKKFNKFCIGICFQYFEASIKLAINTGNIKLSSSFKAQSV